jgi:hypothetical protein
MRLRPLTALAVGSALAIGLGLGCGVVLAAVSASVNENASLLIGGMWGVAVAAAAALCLARRLVLELALGVGLCAGLAATAAFWVRNGFEPAAAFELVTAGLLAGGLGTALAVIVSGATRGRLP